MSEADDVLRSVDQLCRDLSGYHGQLKAHNDLQRHCENQRKRIGELEGLYAKAKAENVKLRELVRDMYGFIERTDEECGDVTFSDCFDYCKHDATDDGCCKTGECWYEQRMRELGVEV